MRQALNLWCVPALFALGCFLTALPQVAHSKEDRPAVHSAPLVQEFTRKHGVGWTIRLSPDKKRIASVLGMSPHSYGKQAEEAAHGFLTENAKLFGLREDLADLRVLSQRSSGVGGNVEFQQVVNGLPVENGRVKVNLDKEGRVLQTASSYLPGIQISMNAAVNADDAREKAIARYLVESAKPRSPRDAKDKSPLLRDQLKLKEPPKVERIVFLTDDKQHATLAYKVLIKADPDGLMEFVVDGQSGAILRVRDLVRYSVNGQGRVFIPNPINALNNGTLRDTGDNAADIPAGAYSDVPLWDLNDPVSGQHYLVGPYVKSEDIDAPNTPLAHEAGTAFNYDRGQDGFEEVMTYFHIDRTQRYIQSLGFIDINNRQIRVDAHGRTDDNANYTPDPTGSGYLKFGDGGSEGGEDADMIMHEYGHSMQDNQVPGYYLHGGETGSMGEGFGDFWASSSYLAESTASGWNPACYDEWDWVNYSGNTGTACERILTNTKVYPADYTGGDIHYDGELWSGALWDTLLQLGKTTADRLALQSHFNVPDNPSFKDGADAVMTADLQLFYGSHLASLCQTFMNRGFYAAADCPTLPPSTGAQSTLVVIASFSDAGLPSVTLAQANTIVNNMNTYLSEVSLGQASLGAPSFRSVSLANNRAHYYDETSHNMLVDMVQEVINLIHASEPGFDFTVVDRLFVVTNDDGSGGVTGGQKEWATTGPWPYPIPTGAGTKRFSASIHTFNQSQGQFDHALGHHFGMFDLYAYDGITFPRPYADGWSNMAKAPGGSFNNVHFFAWDKAKSAWLSGANITFIPRPPADPDPAHRFEQTYPIYREETASGNPVIVQIGTTPNVNLRLNERASYYVEARQKSGTFDSAIPSDAVLVYYVNEDIGQGFGPLRLIDATPGTSNDLTDAGLLPAPSISTLTNIDGSGLNVEVLPKVGSEDYRVHITYDPPETQNDVWIHPHDGNWQSSDIWIDSPACNSGNCGFDADTGRTETDRGDKPQPNHPNRIYARIYNHGPATAHNVQVDFYVSEPWHAIDGGDVDPDTGGNTAFNHHFIKYVGDMPPTETGLPIYVEWTPTTPSGSVHTCIKVKIATVFNDTNPANQASQENIDEYDLTSHSPYPLVQDDFKVVNPYDHGILVYLRPDDVPVGWTADIVPKKAYIPVGGSITASMTIQAPLSYPICSTEFVKATAWYPAGDTLVPLGASVAQVNLKKSTDLTTTTTYQNCKQPLRTTAVMGQTSGSTGGSCQELKTQGCTNPKRPFEHITVTYTGPDGKPVYHDVVTDKDGCFEDFLVNPQGGPWHVDTHYQGSVCTAPSDGPPQTVVVLPGGSIPPGIRERLWYSFHLGMIFPTGAFKENFDPGPSATADIEYQVNERVSLELMYGAHFFDERVPSAVSGLPAGANLIYRNLSVNARAYVPFSWARLYVQGGPGRYFPNYGPTVSGGDVGVGLSFPLLSNFKFEVGTDLHIVDPSGVTRRFFDYKLGVGFRF